MDLADEDWWEDLLYDIKHKQCTPFVGAGASAQWISLSQISRSWAEKYDYPLNDSDQLSEVAEFLALERGDESYPKMALLREVSSIVQPDFSAKEFENTAQSVLADLNLPIYITTNYDSFMEAALKAKGKSPVSEFCRWNESLIQARLGIRAVFDKGSAYIPKPETPLVYHLYGLLDVPQSLVLTEKDYVDFALTLNKGGDQSVLPAYIRNALATTTLLFIGYSLKDMDFRIICDYLMSGINTTSGSSIASLLPPAVSEAKKERARKYLNAIARDRFRIHYVHWGDALEFSVQLRKQIDDYFRRATQ
jgi:hypothetical protein